MTYTDFLRLFPDNDACMDYLRDRFYPAGASCPSCGKATKFHRIKGRSAYSCQYCRHQVYPTAGTIFAKTTTSLQLWFWAIFLMSSTRCGISAKQLEREIGVTYKTAHRMFKQIRTLLAEDDDTPLTGEVEVDETGRVRAKVVPDRKAPTLQGTVIEYVLPEAMIFSDEWRYSHRHDAQPMFWTILDRVEKAQTA